MNNEFTCQYCGKRFVDSSGRKRKFCSHSCNTSNNNTREKIDRPCFTCGKAMSLSPWQIRHSKRSFCSESCFTHWQKTAMMPSGTDHPRFNRALLTCEVCGKDFYRKRTHVQDHVFCGFECYGKWCSQFRMGDVHPNWRGGPITSRGPNWKEQNTLARERDGHICQLCGDDGSIQPLDVHHIIPFRTFGYIVGENDNYIAANELSNLITLCNQCHLTTEPRKHDIIDL